MNEKVYEICRFFGLNYQYQFIKPVAHQLFLWEQCFMLAYNYQSELTLEQFHTRCSHNIINTLYRLIRYNKVSDFKYQSVNLYLNTFKQGDFHYGLRYKNRWFFITHTKSVHAVRLKKEDINGQFKVDDDSCIVSYYPVNAVKYKENIAFIKTELLENMKYENRKNTPRQEEVIEPQANSISPNC